MTDEPSRRRKPLRRTAWTLFAGGLGLLVLMVGLALVLLGGGADIGPGRPAAWPAGERASVHKHPGPQPAESKNCELYGPDGEPEYDWLEWADSTTAPSDLTIRCEQEAILLTGAASSITSALQGPLFVVPISMTVVGTFLFFPRFVLGWARLSNPRSGRWLGPRR